MSQRTDPPPAIGVGMVGYAFMGRAHSLAWNTVGRVFDLPLRPRLAAICGRDKAATRGGGGPPRLGRRGDRLAGADRPRRRPADRHLRARRPARADRDRRPGGGQARALREAARQHPGGSRGDESGRRRRLPRRAPAPWSASTTAASPRSPWRAAGRRRAASARCAISAPSTCRTGSPTRRAPMTWRMRAERAGSGALGDLGAHIVDLARYLTGDEITGVSRDQRDLRRTAPSGR